MNVLRPIQKEFYGDDHRWFLGTVVNAHPPAGLEGRVKVRINGIHSSKTEDIPEKDLPWAQVCIPTTESGVSGYGRIPQLFAGAFVFGIFLDGISSQIPLILGSLPRVELPTSVQKNKVTDVENAYDYSTQRIQNVNTFNFKDDTLSETSDSLRRQQCMKFFIDNGYTPMHAAAITGGLYGISAFITYFDDPEITTIGIAQWKRTTDIGSRFNELLKFATIYQPSADWKRFSIQLQFVLFELRNRFSSMNNRFVSTTNLKDACELFNKYYLFTTNKTESLAQVAYDEVFV